MRLRALVALLILFLPGCFGAPSDERLATPTDRPVVPPTPSSPPPKPPIVLNFDDPGYVTNATWHVGDAWDYQSVSSHYRTMRVVAMRTVGQTTLFQTSETEGLVGNPPNLRYSRWIDGSNWTVVNQTAERGIVSLFLPHAPERYLHNGSYRFNLTTPTETADWQARVSYTGRGPVKMPWGELVEGAHFEHRILITPSTGAYSKVLVVHVFSGDYANDLSYQNGENAEVFRLTAVRYGVRAQGTLIVA